MLYCAIVDVDRLETLLTDTALAFQVGSEGDAGNQITVVKDLEQPRHAAATPAPANQPAGGSQ